MFYTYVLYDKIEKRFYIGFTSDLKKRLQRHLDKGVRATKKMKDVGLVYYEACLSKKDAQAREGQLKTGFGRGYLKRRLKYYLGA